MTLREQILDSAVELFIERGFSATTTRAIAERVGIKQASLYYHFPAKDDIFAALLDVSLRPILEFARALVPRVPQEVPATVALYALASADAEEITSSVHNIGVLWLLPEARQERFDSFWAQRQELQDLYGQLGMAAAPESTKNDTTTDELGALLLYLPELIIHRRRSPGAALPTPRTMADTCLRACGLDERAIEHAREVANSQNLYRRSL